MEKVEFKADYFSLCDNANEVNRVPALKAESDSDPTDASTQDGLDLPLTATEVSGTSLYITFTSAGHHWFSGTTK